MFIFWLLSFSSAFVSSGNSGTECTTLTRNKQSAERGRTEQRNNKIFLNKNVMLANQVGFQIPSFLTKAFAAYTNLLSVHPYPTKIISSGLIGGLGDILIQTVENNGREVPIPFDFRRLAVFSTVAALYIAPVIHVWFDYLNNLQFIQNMSNVRKAGVMMLLDQTIGATVINFLFFVAFEIANYIYPPYNPAKSLLEACVDSAKGNIWVTLVANWKCWPFLNFMNFLLIPVEYRVLVSNVFSVFWNMFLSSVANRDLST